MHRGGFRAQQVNTQTFHTRHGRYRFTLSLAFEYEDRVDKISRADTGFTHQASGKIVAAHAPHTGGRITV